MATSAQQNWLNSDLLSQTQKNSVDLDMESQLAQLLRDKGTFQQQNATSLNQINRLAPQQFQQVSNNYAGRGLLSSSLYQRADDQAFQGVQDQRNQLATQLSDYLNNYDASVQQKKAQAEAQKRSIEAEALQRYAEKMINGVGVGG